MTPEKFIQMWKENKLSERGGAQPYFDDLCDLLGVEKPRDPLNYCYEYRAGKSSGGDGFADVWKRGCFGWENKKPGRDLDAALKQLTDYALQLGNPPILVVCDRERIILHTAFNGYPDEPKEILIDDLQHRDKRELLKCIFSEHDLLRLRPEKSNAAITEIAAAKFADLAKSMRDRGIDGQKVAHFLVQCLFCMFAEDEKLLDDYVFTNLLKKAGHDTAWAAQRLTKLFTAMQKQKGGEYGDVDVPWFNGGLFKQIDVPELTPDDLEVLYVSAEQMDWRSIDPTIFGTLFERGLDPSARAPLGAHYTDTATIDKLIKPLITEPLLAVWNDTKQIIAAGYNKGKRSSAYKEAREAYNSFLTKLKSFRVLDPACGSGNFLYLALKALRDIEKLAHVEAQDYGFEPELFMTTGPHNILGIEKNEYAAELARVTVWIGDIQWCLRNYREVARNPILRSLDGIEHRDAIMTPDGLEAQWPPADVIVGNPPFLGGSKMLGELGSGYVEQLRSCYKSRVPGGADLVTYWFEKARAQIETEQSNMAGFVATQAIRAGSNRKVLQRICDAGNIINAWSDEAWINDGASVRVSLVAFSDKHYEDVVCLNGRDVPAINVDLTAGGEGSVDITQAKPLVENSDKSFEGVQKNGPFEIPLELALVWLKEPNPNGKPNSDVIKPYKNARDVTSRSGEDWLIDYYGLTETEASLYELPFSYVLKVVKPERDKKSEAYLREKYWLLKRSCPDFRKQLAGKERYIVTPRVAKHRFFVWQNASFLPDSRLNAITCDDDTTFGILSSRHHEVWALANASMHGVGNDPTYNAKSCFETFPFPAGLQAESDKAVVAAAVALDKLRENWLNPPEWVDWVITPQEEKAGFPKRPVLNLDMNQTSRNARSPTCTMLGQLGWITLTKHWTKRLLLPTDGMTTHLKCWMRKY